MDENMRRLDSYFEALKAQREKLPSLVGPAAPHFRMISAAAGVDFRYVIKEPYRQRVMLAVEEIGLTPKEGTEAVRWEARFTQNLTKLNNYLRWLKENRHKLPEDPTYGGRVFFPQVVIEADLAPYALTLKKGNGELAYNVRLRQEIEKAAPKLGIEVRVLPQSPGEQRTPFTYERLFDKGTEERRKELAGSGSAGAQLSNTRYALNLFLKTLDVEATAPVGHEFVAGFKGSVEKVTGEISNLNSRKKFNTEIKWWQDTYHRLLKGPSIPDDIQQAIVHLIDRSGLSLSVLAKLIGIGSGSLKAWYEGHATPSLLSVRALERMELLFKISAGTLVNKISGVSGVRRFRRSELPPFLQEKPGLFDQVSKHLPDNFCTLKVEVQKEIVDSIQANILRGGDDKYAQRLLILSRLPYRLQKWPGRVRKEFDSHATRKMDDGAWRPATKEKSERDFGYLFGAICLPPGATDKRLRGLGFPKSQLTLALITCPELIAWYIKFRCEARSQYTEYPIDLMEDFMAMLRPGTGWLRQNPHLAKRLRPFAVGDTQYVPKELVSRAQTDWAGVCDAAIAEFEVQIKKIEPRVTVGRDPFHRIDGQLELNDPMEPYGDLLIEGMKRDLPNPNTQPVLYHTAIRDLVITLLIVVTGFRRGILPQLGYTGDETGHLYFEDGHYVLFVPREFFKNAGSSFFQSNRVKEDYLNVLLDVFGLNELFKEYVEISRPFLMKRYHSRSSEQPLFPTSYGTGSAGTEAETAGLSGERISSIYREKVEKYLVENKYRGTGIRGVKRAGPHSVRHVRGTTVYRKKRSFKLAGDANQISERTARKYYSRDRVKERNQDVNQILFDDK